MQNLIDAPDECFRRFFRLQFGALRVDLILDLFHLATETRVMSQRVPGRIVVADIVITPARVYCGLEQIQSPIVLTEHPRIQRIEIRLVVHRSFPRRTFTLLIFLPEANVELLQDWQRLCLLSNMRVCPGQVLLRVRGDSARSLRNRNRFERSDRLSAISGEGLEPAQVLGDPDMLLLEYQAILMQCVLELSRRLASWIKRAIAAASCTRSVTA